MMKAKLDNLLCKLGFHRPGVWEKFDGPDTPTYGTFHQKKCSVCGVTTKLEFSYTGVDPILLDEPDEFIFFRFCGIINQLRKKEP
jgi:hypothetical protein